MYQPRCGESSVPTVPGGSPIVEAEEVRTTRRHARAGGGAHGGLGAVDVDAAHRLGVLGAQRVDAGDVVGELAALHGRGQRVLVERRRRGRRGAARRERRAGGVGARQRDHLVAALDQPASTSAPPTTPLPPVRKTRLTRRRAATTRSARGSRRPTRP